MLPCRRQKRVTVDEARDLESFEREYDRQGVEGLPDRHPQYGSHRLN